MKNFLVYFLGGVFGDVDVDWKFQAHMIGVVITG